MTNGQQKKLRVGLIGAGMIGQLRARAMAEVPQIEFVAVADAREELARKVAAGDPVIRVYTDGLALAADPNVDAVIVSTPPASHEKLGVACLNNKKHVLCEKPLATTVAACEALVNAAERNGVTLATGFNLRYTRAAALAKKIIAEGGIGELDHIRAFHGHPGGKEFGHDWVFDRKVTGGGALMDNGIHLIDLTRYFLGDVQSCKGFASNHVWHKPGCEDNGFVLLKNTSGRIATLQASWSEWRGYGYRLEIYGTTGFIRFGYPPMKLVHGLRIGERTRIKRHIFPAYQVLERVKGWEWGLIETLSADLLHWADALLQRRPAPISGRDGLEAVRIAQSAEFDDA
ncbi:MAG TPA: Gfo/Idh/MocA family oxidoreductase [Tepidisphaeraceae bacterium]